MLNRGKSLGLLALFGSIMFILAGVMLLRNESIGMGTAMLLAGVGLFLISERRIQSQTITDDEKAALSPLLIPALLFMLAFVLSFLAVYTMSLTDKTAADDRLVSVYWFLSMIILAVSTLWLDGWKPASLVNREWIKTHAREIVLVLALFATGLFLRTYLIEQHPYPWSGDEASVGIDARRILRGEITNLFDASWSGQPNWSFVPTAVSMAIWGDRLFSLRIVSALFGALSIIGLYLLARELFDQRVALLAAVFLAVFSYHLQFSRIGVNNINDSFSVTFGLWFLMRAIRQGRMRDYLWAGIFSGLTIYTYVGSRLVLILVLMVLAYLCIRQKDFIRTHAKQLGVFLAAVFVAVAPLGYYFYTHPDVFLTRLSQEGIFMNGWLVHQMQETGRSAFSILLDQLRDSTLVFISQPAVTGFFNSPQPYLTLLGSLMFLLGMGISFQNIREIRYGLILLWFWSVVTLGGILTVSPPANTRLVMTSPAVSLFVAIGIIKLMDLLTHMRVGNRLVQAAGLALILALVFQNTYFYFGEYRSKYYFSDANGELATEAGVQLRGLGPDYSFYMLGIPRIFAGFPTIEFLAPSNSKVDVPNEQAAALDLSHDKAAFIVAIPGNESFLAELARRYPGGQWIEVPRKTQVEILYYGYILKPGEISAVP